MFWIAHRRGTIPVDGRLPCKAEDDPRRTDCRRSVNRIWEHSMTIKIQRRLYTYKTQEPFLGVD